jgi:hypothetical protein
MKNIHILPTDKPNFGRYLVFNKENTLCIWDTELIGGQKTLTPHHIYITSDEQPKHNDYYTTDGKEIYYCNTLNPTRNNHYKKVILTTDPDLIADGVQAIDDEFLEWFVKNPSCESVEVDIVVVYDDNNYGSGVVFHSNKKFEYKIIIPQEEPKQETLEEAAANLADPNLCKTDNWIAGAKWQAERMYSEEEVEIIIQKLMNDVHCGDLCYGDNVIDFKKSPRQWFEQFKKK